MESVVSFWNIHLTGFLLGFASKSLCESCLSRWSTSRSLSLSSICLRQTVPLYSPLAQRWEELLRGFGQKKHQEPPRHSVVTTGAACGSRKPARGWLKAEAFRCQKAPVAPQHVPWRTKQKEHVTDVVLSPPLWPVQCYHGFTMVYDVWCYNGRLSNCIWLTMTTWKQRTAWFLVRRFATVCSHDDLPHRGCLSVSETQIWVYIYI